MREEDNTFGERILCADGNCKALVGPDNLCKICGMQYEMLAPQDTEDAKNVIESKRSRDDWESSPRPSKGVLWWGGFLCFLNFYELMNHVQRGGVPSEKGLLLVLIFSVMCFLTCYWWYDQSKKLRRRGKLARAIGLSLFFLGSTLVSKGHHTLVVSLSIPAPNFVIAHLPYLVVFFSIIGLLVLAYYVEFRPD